MKIEWWLQMRRVDSDARFGSTHLGKYANLGEALDKAKRIIKEVDEQGMTIFVSFWSDDGSQPALVHVVKGEDGSPVLVWAKSLELTIRHLEQSVGGQSIVLPLK